MHTPPRSVKTLSARFLAAALAALVLTHAPVALAAPNAILWGVNAHPLNGGVYADYEKQFQIMKENHLTTYRMNISLTKDSFDNAVAQTRILVGLAQKYGITLRPVLELPFTWGDRTDSKQYPAGNAQALYQQGYYRTYNFVSLFRNDIQEWELQNELNLLVTDNGHRLYGKGWTAAEFDTPLMRDWGQVMKGMSDAISKINSTSGTQLKRIVGTTSTNFGFLDFMKSQGVNFEIIGYHYYVPLSSDPYKSWSLATPAFNLFARLGQYNKPVHFTEVNAAEIYDAPYLNKEADGYTQKGYQSLEKELTDLKNEKGMDLEEVDVYALFDEPNKAPPENHFGLMYNETTPKKALSILSAIAAP